jgi:hypothetical protein
MSTCNCISVPMLGLLFLANFCLNDLAANLSYELVDNRLIRKRELECALNGRLFGRVHVLHLHIDVSDSSVHNSSQLHAL